MNTLRGVKFVLPAGMFWYGESAQLRLTGPFIVESDGPDHNGRIWARPAGLNGMHVMFDYVDLAKRRILL